MIKAMYGDQQGGGYGGGDITGRACLWSGTPESLVDLHPRFNPYYLQVNAMDGDSQGGETVAAFGGWQHAALWYGSIDSYVDLHPSGRVRSVCSAVSNGVQGGEVDTHAALWCGTAASFVDMNPADFLDSKILGMDGAHQVGWGTTQSSRLRRALMWSGTASSAVDMNPPVALQSQMFGSCGTAQVGLAQIRGVWGAGIWFGSSSSFIDLGSLLPPGQYVQSQATSVKQVDGVFYVSGYALNAVTRHNEAFSWIGVPTPGTAAVLGAAGVMAARRHRR